MGTDPLFFNTPLDVTPTTEDKWTNADVSACVDADADGVILFILSTQDDDRDYGVREIGSSFSTITTDLENRSSTMYAWISMTMTSLRYTTRITTTLSSTW